MELKNRLELHYSGYDEDGRLLTRYRQVEYLTTMRYIEKYLRPACRILEVGAGTGRYSHALARMGYRVDAVELTEHNLSILRQTTLPSERLTAIQGNALDLSGFSDNTYDITLVLGPMYHLYTAEDKVQALREAVRVTKTGGVIFAAYCMADPAIVQYAFRRGGLQDTVARGQLDLQTFRTTSYPFDLFELYRTEDIDALRERLPVTQLHYVAADGYTNHMRDTMEAMDDTTFDIYLKYHLATCERRDLIGFSNHTLDIFRKD